jgi:two-component system phosphate regulon sensor histidine kinase PhoR
MRFEAWGIQGSFYLQISQLSAQAWFLVVAYTLILVAILWASRRGWRKVTGARLLLFVAFVPAAALSEQVLLLRFEPPYLLPPPGLPEVPAGPAIPLLGGVLILLSGAWLGVGPAVVVGLASGLARAGWGSYRLSQPFELALLAALAAYLLRQHYHGRLTTTLRQPIVAGPLSAALTWPLLAPGLVLQNSEPSLASINYTLALMAPALATAVIEMLIGGAVVQLVYRRLPSWRPNISLPLQSTPWQTGLGRRLLYTLLPITLLGVLVLIGAVTLVGFNTSTDLVVDQMARDADNAASAILFFIHTGSSLIQDLADTLGSPDADVDTALSEGAHTVPFFWQILYYATADQPAHQYPDPPDGLPAVTQQEQDLVKLALASEMPQDTAIFPSGGQGLIVSFIAPVRDARGTTVGAILGRTSLDVNPLMQPIISNLASIADGRGEGFIIAKDDQIILHPNQPDRVMQLFTLGPNAAPIATEGPGMAYRRQARDGSLQLAYLQAVRGTDSWSVVILTPNLVVLERAAQIAVPLAVLLALISVVALVSIYALASRIARPIGQLDNAADRIAGGDLAHPIPVAGQDEVGRLSASFERMRVHLKDQLDEQALLLQIGQAVSAGLDLQSTVPPILEGCLKVTIAAGARIVLSEGDGQQSLAYAAGEAADDMAALDRRLLELVQAQGRLVIDYLSRAQAVVDTSALQRPLESLVALPLRQEGDFLGVLWLGYSQVHRFTESELTFLGTLASQATVTIAKVRLFEEVHSGREQLEIILTSTDDAVLVADRHRKLVMVNPAAEALFQIEQESVQGRPVVQVLNLPELLALFQSDGTEPETSEVVSHDGRTYEANASPLMTPLGVMTGRVVVLHDITHFKELDEMKDDFVQTVSHDLRSPLTYMRGYATMLGMVGPLNEKQQKFSGRIIVAIEQMSNLIENILNIGRLESGGELEREPCDVAELVNSVVSGHRAQALTKGIALSANIASDLPVVMAAEHMLRQAITNLVDNAIKYTPQGGHVDVVARPDERHIIVSVADDGPGISQPDQAHLFEKFYRVHKRGSSSVRGSGLGLAIVQGVARRHGGDAWVESRLGQGSTFYLSIEVSSKPEGAQ